MRLPVRIILFAYLSGILALTVLHNPFDGYANTSTSGIYGKEFVFRSNLRECGGDAQDVWAYYYDKGRLMTSLMTRAEFDARTSLASELQRLQARESPELKARAQKLNEVCVGYQNLAIPGTPVDPLEWISRGALVSWLSTLQQYAIFAGALTAISSIAYALFAREQDR